MRLIALAMAWFMSACGSDVAGAVDAGPGGLAFVFHAAPAVPGWDDEVTINSVEVVLRPAYATGDSAPALLPETTAPFHLLAWHSSVDPEPIEFPSAPMGSFDNFYATMASQDHAPAFRIEGEVVIDGETRPFRIIGADGGFVEVELYLVEVQPGPKTVVHIDLDAFAVVRLVEWDDFAGTTGEITIDSGYERMATMVEEMAGAFSQPWSVGP